MAFTSSLARSVMSPQITIKIFIEAAVFGRIDCSSRASNKFQ